MTSTSPPPRRRFLPQPVELSTRSSKRPHYDGFESIPTVEDGEHAEIGTLAPATKPRRFIPQPIEESTRTSRKKDIDQDGNVSTQHQESKTRGPGFSDDSTLPGHPTTRPKENGRRFAPQPVETTSRTTRRKFAPEPVETTKRSSKDKSAKEQGTTSTSSQPRRKFLPEPVETTSVRRRWQPGGDETMSDSETSSKASSRKSSMNHKFSPELIETAKGQFRRAKKESGSPTPGSPVQGTLENLLSDIPHPPDAVPESRFSAASLAKRHHEEHRRHSYCVPTLPPIESDSSEEESAPSLTHSPSDTDHESHKLYRISEVKSGRDGTSFTDFVLSLADKRKLQEQAMAAYINEVPHEQVNHFAVEDDDDDDSGGVLHAKDGVDPRTFRRSSQDELNLEMQNMRKHHEQLEQAKRELAQDTAGASRFSAAALAARHHLNLAGPAKPKPKKENDEYAKIRAAASPPMLGDELVFPFTVSPKMTRCDVDQAPRPRQADSDDEETESEVDPALWNPTISVSNRSSMGLWMGLCQKGPEDGSRPTTPIKSGIQTPAFEGPNPFDAMTPGRGSRTPVRRPARPGGVISLTPMTPPKMLDGRDAFTESIDKKLEREKQIDDEFPNAVITQIYNYLSLGYPSLAKPFDEELSKISRTSVAELRKDDEMASKNVKGYVGAPESEGNWEEDDKGALRGCRRWEALRLYVREWARQSPTFVSDGPSVTNFDYRATGMKSSRAEAWGATVRRGSWAQ